MQSSPYYSIPFSPPFEKAQRKDSVLLWVAIAVISLHGLGMALGMISFVPEVKKQRQTVVVKTVQLNPRLEPIAAPPKVQTPVEAPPLPAPPTPVETPKVEKVPEVVTPAPPKEVVQPVKPPPPKPPPPAAKKVETKPAPAPVKKSVPEIKKPAAVKKPVTPAPVKKVVEQSPKAKAPEVDKKLQQEQSAAKAAEKAKQQAIAAAEAAARQKQQELLSKAKESLAKMGQTAASTPVKSSLNLAETSMPKQIQSLQIDALPVAGALTLGSGEISYRDEVASRLKLALRLPDYGAVKVKLTLSKAGKVTQVEITSSESQKNKQYIEKTLPTLFFPPFGSQFDGASQYTFMITLNNDN